MSEDLHVPNEGSFLFYDTEDGTTRVHLLVDGSTVWVPQKAIADLFESTVANVNTHIRNILDDSEVQAGSVIKDYLITAVGGKQYKIKNGVDYFEELLERIRAIQPNMGLQTWKSSPAGKIRKSDVTTAKNYSTQEESSELNRFVTMYLDYAEDQARRGKLMRMAEWAGKLDAYLTFNDRAVLRDAGKVEKKVADALAFEQFDQYQTVQRRIEASQPTSDFDQFVEGIKHIKPSVKESEDE